MYLEYNQVANTLKQYNQAALSLINIKNWWVALGADQVDQKNIDKLVDLVETTLQTESSGWVQQLQSALAKLHTQQAKQDENSPTNQEDKRAVVPTSENQRETKGD